jgi:hypothetical protein
VDWDPGEKQVGSGDGHLVVDADEAHVPAGAGGVDRLHGRLLGAHGLDHGVRSEPIRELLDPRDAVVAALLDDVGRAVEAGQLLSFGVAGHRDDPLGAKLSGRQDTHESDRAVTDDRDGLAWAGFGSDCGEPAGAEHVGCRQQRGDQLRVSTLDSTV